MLVTPKKATSEKGKGGFFVSLLISAQQHNYLYHLFSVS
jgi:hypothetical protein